MENTVVACVGVPVNLYIRLYTYRYKYKHTCR